MDTIDLELVVEDSGKSGVRRIGRIPERVWRMFCDQAKETLPEKADNAWAAVISELITQHIVTDQFTYILSQIPIKARDMLDMATSQAQMTVDNLISGIFYSALVNRIHILNIQPVEDNDGYHCIVVTGLPDSSWEAWRKFADKFNQETGEKISPEQMIAEIFKRSETSELTVSQPVKSDNNDMPPNNTEDDNEVIKAKIRDLMAEMGMVENAGIEN